MKIHKNHIKYYGLSISLLSIIASFLFYARAQGIFFLLLLGGYFFSFLFYLAVLVNPENWKTKLKWTLIVFLALVIHYYSPPVLVKKSYQIYYLLHKKQLENVCRILKDKENGIGIMREVSEKIPSLSDEEKEKLLQLKNELGIYMISKYRDEVNFGLWGFLDVRLGLTCMTKPHKPRKEIYHLKDNWYIH